MKSKTPTTKKAIAAALKISRTTLDRYLEMEGAPREGPDGWDFGKVSKWIATKARTTAATSKSNPELAALKIRELKIKCDRLAHKFEVEKGLHIQKSVVGPALRNLALHHRATLQRKLENELPARLVNRTELEILQEMKNTVDDICGVFEEGTKQWMESSPSS